MALEKLHQGRLPGSSFDTEPIQAMLPCQPVVEVTAGPASLTSLVKDPPQGTFMSFYNSLTAVPHSVIVQTVQELLFQCRVTITRSHVGEHRGHHGNIRFVVSVPFRTMDGRNDFPLELLGFSTIDIPVFFDSFIKTA